MLSIYYKIIGMLFLASITQLSDAQKNQATIFNKDSEFPIIIDLNWLNEQFLIKQRNRLDKITRENFGQQLKVGKNNLPLLQRLINESTIPSTDKLELQAMGVILGDVFVAYHKNLSWRVYEDELGKSHAVCIDNSEHCLFPVTMLSRRIEVGLKPNVKRVFDKGIADIEPHLPKLPFAD